MPLLSIVVDKEDLYNQERGIIANPLQKGRKWERLANVSYFEANQLQFYSAAGIGIHGHVSRMSKKKSYRLYFRNEMSRGKFPCRIFKYSQAMPFHRMVIHQDWPQDMPFTTNMAFDIGERIGCTIPRIKPVRLFLIGESQGVYWISDHLNKKQWSAHIGHDDFSIFRPLAENDPVSYKNYVSFVGKISKLKDNQLLEEAGRLVDLNNLSRYIFTIIFCGDDDWEKQGAALLDNRTPHPKWYWILWDMDHSFSDYLPGNYKRKPWE